MNNFIADGALHEHEMELFFLILNGVLFACFSTDETHCCVRQDRLQDRQTEAERTALQQPQTSARSLRLCVETI